MSKVQAGETVEFRLQRPIKSARLAKIIRSLAREGLLTDYDPGVDYSLEISATEQAHFEATKPRSRKDYVGREHCICIGLNHGFKRGKVSGVFNSLAFPLTIDHGRAGDVIDPLDLGLVVARREDIDPPFPLMPHLDDELKKDPRLSHGERKHSQELYGATTQSQDMVVQVGGIIDISERPEDLTRLFNIGNGSMDILSVVGADLSLLVDT